MNNMIDVQEYVHNILQQVKRNGVYEGPIGEFSNTVQRYIYASGQYSIRKRGHVFLVFPKDMSTSWCSRNLTPKTIQPGVAIAIPEDVNKTSVASYVRRHFSGMAISIIDDKVIVSSASSRILEQIEKLPDAEINEIINTLIKKYKR
jgi:hypothetical protein